MGLSLFVLVPNVRLKCWCRKFLCAIQKALPSLLYAELAPQSGPLGDLEEFLSSVPVGSTVHGELDGWVNPSFQADSPLRRGLLLLPYASTRGVLITCAPAKEVRRCWSFLSNDPLDEIPMLIAVRLVTGFNVADARVAVRFLLTVLASSLLGCTGIFSEYCSTPLCAKEALEHCRSVSIRLMLYNTELFDTLVIPCIPQKLVITRENVIAFRQEFFDDWPQEFLNLTAVKWVWSASTRSQMDCRPQLVFRDLLACETHLPDFPCGNEISSNDCDDFFETMSQENVFSNLCDCARRMIARIDYQFLGQLPASIDRDKRKWLQELGRNVSDTVEKRIICLFNDFFCNARFNEVCNNSDVQSRELLFEEIGREKIGQLDDWCRRLACLCGFTTVSFSRCVRYQLQRGLLCLLFAAERTELLPLARSTLYYRDLRSLHLQLDRNMGSLCAWCLNLDRLSRSHVVSQKVYSIFGWTRCILDIQKAKYVNIMRVAPRMLCQACESKISSVEKVFSDKLVLARFDKDLRCTLKNHVLTFRTSGDPPLVLYRYLAQLFVKTMLSEAATNSRAIDSRRLLRLKSAFDNPTQAPEAERPKFYYVQLPCAARLVDCLSLQCAHWGTSSQGDHLFMRFSCFYFAFPCTNTGEIEFQSSCLNVVDWREATQNLTLSAPNSCSENLNLFSGNLSVEHEFDELTLQILLARFAPSDARYFASELNRHCVPAVICSDQDLPENYVVVSDRDNYSISTLFSPFRIVFVPFRAIYGFQDQRLSQDFCKIVGAETNRTVLNALNQHGQYAFCGRQSILSFFGATALPISMSVFEDLATLSDETVGKSYLCVIHIRLECFVVGCSNGAQTFSRVGYDLSAKHPHLGSDNYLVETTFPARFIPGSSSPFQPFSDHVLLMPIKDCEKSEPLLYSLPEQVRGALFPPSCDYILTDPRIERDMLSLISSILYPHRFCTFGDTVEKLSPAVQTVVPSRPHDDVLPFRPAFQPSLTRFQTILVHARQWLDFFQVGDELSCGKRPIRCSVKVPGYLFRELEMMKLEIKNSRLVALMPDDELRRLHGLHLILRLARDATVQAQIGWALPLKHEWLDLLLSWAHLGANRVGQPSDGDCLFHAIRLATSDDPRFSTHESFREVACNWMLLLGREHLGFLTMLQGELDSLRDGSISSVDSYVARMRCAGACAGPVELMALVLALDIFIAVFQYADGDFIPQWYPSAPHDTDSFPALNLDGSRKLQVKVLFINKNHFELLVSTFLEAARLQRHSLGNRPCKPLHPELGRKCEKDSALSFTSLPLTKFQISTLSTFYDPVDSFPLTDRQNFGIAKLSKKDSLGRYFLGYIVSVLRLETYYAMYFWPTSAGCCLCGPISMSGVELQLPELSQAKEIKDAEPFFTACWSVADLLCGERFRSLARLQGWPDSFRRGLLFVLWIRTQPVNVINYYSWVFPFNPRLPLLYDRPLLLPRELEGKVIETVPFDLLSWPL